MKIIFLKTAFKHNNFNKKKLFMFLNSTLIIYLHILTISSQIKAHIFIALKLYQILWRTLIRYYWCLFYSANTTRQKVRLANRGIQFSKKVLSGILRKFYVFQGVSKVHNAEILPNHGAISFYETLPAFVQCKRAGNSLVDSHICCSRRNLIFVVQTIIYFF